MALYWEDHSGNMGDGYFSDMDALLDHCEQNDLEVPKYVYACTENSFRMDAEELVSGELEAQEFYDGAFDHITAEQLKELDVFLEAWAKKVNLVCFIVDYSRAIILHPESA